MSIININGLILKSSSYREKDKLLILYSPAIGKIQALCKAARDPMNHWSSSMDPPLLAWCSLYEKNSFYQFIDIREMNVFINIRNHYRSRLVYHALLEAVQHIPFSEPAENVFHLLLETLMGIEQEDKYADWFYYRFMIRFLCLQGFPRDITTCHECGKPVNFKQDPIYFSYSSHSFLCSDCEKKDATALKVEKVICEIWERCQTSKVQDFLKEKTDFFHNFNNLDRIISVIVKQVFYKDFATLAEIEL